jgi:hypothetical protein
MKDQEKAGTFTGSEWTEVPATTTDGREIVPFWNFKENRVLICRIEGDQEIEIDGTKKTFLVAVKTPESEREAPKKYLLNPYHAIVKAFDKHGTSPFYRIEFSGMKDIEGGKKVAEFSIAVKDF